MLSKERQIVNGFGVFLRNIFQLPYYCTVKALESQGLSAFFPNLSFFDCQAERRQSLVPLRASISASVSQLPFYLF
jgi:hypothetical protein